MILNFDSGKQRNYWIYIFIGFIGMYHILEMIFGDINEKFDNIFIFLIISWIFIGKYILRYVIKIK
tara:strand:+ start:519 stop:716 length:198 start_codon:yes stop_codon:yes gene_type:complete